MDRDEEPIWQESSHVIDVRPLDRTSTQLQGKAVRKNIDIALFLKFLDGTYKDISIHDEKINGKKEKEMNSTKGGKGAKGAKKGKRARDGEDEAAGGTRKKTKRNSGKAVPALELDTPEETLTGTSTPDVTMDDVVKPNGVLREEEVAVIDLTSDPVKDVDMTVPDPVPAPPMPLFTLPITATFNLLRGPEVEAFPPSSKLHKLCSLSSLHKEEESLLSSLQRKIRTSSRTSSSNTHGTDLGAINLRAFGRQLRLHASINDTAETGPLMSFDPPVPFGGEAEDHDFSYTSTSSPASVLHAALLLAGLPEPRVKVESTLFASSQPTESGGSKQKDQLPIQLLLRTEIHVMPAIYTHPWSLPLHHQEAQRLFLSHLFPSPPPPESWPGITNVHWFYELLGPAPALLGGESTELQCQPEKMDAVLLPFQRRSVGWLLEREGATVPVGTSSSASSDPQGDQQYFLYHRAISPFLPPSLEQSMFYSPLMGSLLPNRPLDMLAIPGRDGVLGGMLSEEMGLGKTLECLGLLLLNPPPSTREPANIKHQLSYDLSGEATDTRVREVGTTLIVSPASLQQQWADEIALHAPELKVLVYRGWRKEIDGVGRKQKAKAGGRRKSREVKLEEDEEKEKEDGVDEETFLSTWAAHVHEHDIVLTTYDDIRKEFYVSQPRRARPKRDTANYSLPEGADAVIRSPLVSVEWWRVVMDEVQLQGDGKAAAVVSLIPRRASVAVSGTPVQDDIRDLVQVLKFLRVPILSDSPRFWQRLLKPAFADAFRELFQRIGIRTLKKQVEKELTIPPQRRYLVPIEMGPVERHLYNDLLDSAYAALHVDSLGNPVGESGQMDVSQLRTWLLRLRQSCTHPQIGQLHRNDRVLGGALRSIGEVLELMRYQNRQGILNEKRDRLEHRVKHALLLQLDESNAARWKQSLELFLVLKEDIQALVDEVKSILDAQIAVARAERKAARDKAQGLPDSHLLGDGSYVRQRKGKEVEHEGEDSEDDDAWMHEEEEEDGRARGKMKENRVKTSNIRIRECYVLQHKIFFALGDLYHKLGKPEEDEAYAGAEKVRRTVLKNTEDIALRAMDKLTLEVAEKGVGEAELEVGPIEERGLRAGLLYDEAEDIIDLLNDQRDLLWKWRGMIFTRLTQKLTSGQGEEASGEEYAHALDAQGEAEAYITVYAALLADRKEALARERTILAIHESREKKSRDTQAAQSAGLDLGLAAEAAEMEPQNEVLMRKLTEERKALRGAHSKRSLKAVALEISGLFDWREEKPTPEQVILKMNASKLRKVVTDQEALCNRLESELGLFRQAFNGRIVYFRQLQELSDSVMDLNTKEFGDKPLLEVTQEELDKIRKLDESLRTQQAKQRYLDYMDEGQRNAVHGIDNTEARECVLCASEFENGCLTACGHIYCEDCLKAWLKKPGNKFCPVCRQPLSKQTIHRIVFQAGQKVDEGEEPVEPEPLSASSSHIDYNVIDVNLLREIDEIEAHGNYGSKVQALVKHLLYLKMKEPDAKSIVFSAWVDSLNIIARALQDNGISCIRVEAGRNAAREFRLDPACRVLLLHGERENAGLNVTCANRVFLLEPVVNHAFEVQAIGRVDRMGQTHNTEVFCYYAIDTVEKGVLDLAARTGVSIYTKDHARGTLNMSELGDEGVGRSPKKGTKKGKGDFMAKTDDMMVILFPHLADPGHVHEDVMEVDVDVEEEVMRERRRTEAALAAERRRSQAGPSTAR